MFVEIVDTDFQNDLTLLKLPENFQFTLANTIGFRGGPPPNIQPKASEARLSIGLPDEGARRSNLGLSFHGTIFGDPTRDDC